MDLQQFQKLADLIPNIIWMQSPQRQVTYINGKWAEYTGIEFDISNPQSWQQCIHPTDYTAISTKVGNSIGKEVEFEYRLLGKDGKYRWHLSRMVPVKNEAQEFIQWIGSVTNIDDVKQAQEATRIAEEGSQFLAKATTLLASSLDYKDTLKSIGDLIVPKLADWCVIDVLEPGDQYPKTMVLKHIDPEKLKLADIIREKYPTDWEAPTGLPQVLKTGKSEIYANLSDEILKTGAKDEEHFQILKSLGMRSVIIVPIVGTKKTPMGAMSLVAAEIGRDFTTADLDVAEELGRRAGLAIDRSRIYESEKNAREEAEKAKKMAEEANLLKSTFLANMSHEIRTPLNALIGFNDLLKDLPANSPERERYHAIIERNGELLLRLIDDILDLSKVEAGQLTLEKIPVSLPDLIAEVTSSFNLKASEKKIKFLVKSDSTVPETIITDPTRLKQILNNIIGNAIKFTEAGSVSVFVSKNWTKKCLHFEIADTGIGIENKDQEKLFKVFNQADLSTTRKFGGSGLGLALSKKLAQSLGGDLWLDSSNPGVGSKFVFEIEGSLSAEKHSELFSGHRRDFKVSVDPHQLSNRNILLVEDSYDNQLLIDRYLTVRGAKVEKAENGQLGVERAMSQAFDLILMDMQMPVLDGYSATKIIRSQGFRGPVIALTAHAMDEDRQLCLDAGCDDYITKPVKASVLADMIEKYTSKK